MAFLLRYAIILLIRIHTACCLKTKNISKTVVVTKLFYWNLFARNCRFLLCELTVHNLEERSRDAIEILNACPLPTLEHQVRNRKQRLIIVIKTEPPSFITSHYAPNVVTGFKNTVPVLDNLAVNVQHFTNF